MRNSSILARAYRFLYFASAFGAVVAFVELQSANLLGLDNFAATIFGIASLLQQFTVYQDLHRLEEDSPLVTLQYRGWINLRLERFLRTLIVLTLLLGVGKFAGPIAAAFDLGVLINKGKVFLAFLLPNLSESLEQLGKSLGDLWNTYAGGWWVILADFMAQIPGRLFSLACTALFLFLLIWNLCALRRRTRPVWLPRSPGINDPLHYYAREIVLNIQIGVFIVVSLISLVYWSLVFIGLANIISGFAILIIGIYGMLILLLFRFRMDRRRDRLIAILREVFQNADRFRTWQCSSRWRHI